MGGEPTLTPYEEYCDVFELAEFREHVQMGVITPDDGSGYWGAEVGYARESVWAPRPPWATHVAWFNK